MIADWREDLVAIPSYRLQFQTQFGDSYSPGLEPWGEAVYNIQIAASTIELAISKARELMKEQFGVVGQPVLVKCELTHGV